MPTGRRTSSFAHDVARSGVTPLIVEKAGAQTVAALPQRLYNATNVPLRVKKIHVAVGTAPTGTFLAVDAKINGTSVFANAADRPKVNASAFAGEAVPTKTDETAITVLPGQYVTVEVTQIGSTVAGSDLVVQVHLGAL